MVVSNSASTCLPNCAATNALTKALSTRIAILEQELNSIGGAGQVEDEEILIPTGRNQGEDLETTAYDSTLEDLLRQGQSTNVQENLYDTQSALETFSKMKETHKLSLASIENSVSNNLKLKFLQYSSMKALLDVYSIVGNEKPFLRVRSHTGKPRKDGTSKVYFDYKCHICHSQTARIIFDGEYFNLESSEKYPLAFDHVCDISKSFEKEITRSFKIDKLEKYELAKDKLYPKSFNLFNSYLLLSGLRNIEIQKVVSFITSNCIKILPNKTILEVTDKIPTKSMTLFNTVLESFLHIFNILDPSVFQTINDIMGTNFSIETTVEKYSKQVFDVFKTNNIFAIDEDPASVSLPSIALTLAERGVKVAVQYKKTANGSLFVLSDEFTNKEKQEILNIYCKMNRSGIEFQSELWQLNGLQMGSDQPVINSDDIERNGDDSQTLENIIINGLNGAGDLPNLDTDINTGETNGTLKSDARTSTTTNDDNDDDDNDDDDDDGVYLGRMFAAELEKDDHFSENKSEKYNISNFQTGLLSLKNQQPTGLVFFQNIEPDWIKHITPSLAIDACHLFNKFRAKTSRSEVLINMTTLTGNNQILPIGSFLTPVENADAYMFFLSVSRTIFNLALSIVFSSCCWELTIGKAICVANGCIVRGLNRRFIYQVS
ncbi:hypothetical protein WICPIJ_009353 [Wickerhamomyces pijperi]|uniref:Uncharacterized protein n=1 Tax=Wickerhamomyces pijperi TaxID=599730 RepID=A0A9P8PQ09_WICPI|nr:hypothetical protein WICPIJ_009353 [Wickerhamomyces pijperi]